MSMLWYPKTSVLLVKPGSVQNFAELDDLVLSVVNDGSFGGECGWGTSEHLHAVEEIIEKLKRVRDNIVVELARRGS